MCECVCSVFCVQWSVFSVLCSVFCVQCSVFSVLCSVVCVQWSVFSGLRSVVCVQWSVFCGLCSVICVLWSAFCGLRSVVCVLTWWCVVVLPGVVVVWCVVVRMVVKCWEGWVDNFHIVYCREREPSKRAAESHQVEGRGRCMLHTFASLLAHICFAVSTHLLRC